MSTKIYSAITEPTQSHPERALYKQTYVNTMMALLPALMKAAPQVSATVAHETLVLGPGFTFAIDIDGFGRAITFEQHGSSWRVAADKEPDFVIEFRDLDYAFDVFSGAISLKEALAARLFATHGANSKGVAITYLFDTVLRTFFCWRSAYRRIERRNHNLPNARALRTCVRCAHPLHPNFYAPSELLLRRTFMNAFEFHCPTRIICGEHALHKLPVILVEMGVTKPLVVTDANLVALGITDHAIHRLTEAGFPFAFYDQVPPDSSLSVVNDVAAIYEQEGCDGFIAFGGGSVIDTTKGAAASISVGNRDIAELQGAEILQNDLDPLIAIPTTAGTGSEVTLVAVIADEEAHEKLSYTSYKLVPHVAFLDPLLTASLPPKLTATTGVDALTHAIEAYTSIQKNPVSDALARQAISLIMENLVRSCEEPGNLDVSHLARARQLARGRQLLERHGGHRARDRPFARRHLPHPPWPGRDDLASLLRALQPRTRASCGALW